MESPNEGMLVKPDVETPNEEMVVKLDVEAPNEEIVVKPIITMEAIIKSCEDLTTNDVDDPSTDIDVPADSEAVAAFRKATSNELAKAFAEVFLKDIEADAAVDTPSTLLASPEPTSEVNAPYPRVGLGMDFGSWVAVMVGCMKKYSNQYKPHNKPHYKPYNKPSDALLGSNSSNNYLGNGEPELLDYVCNESSNYISGNNSSDVSLESNCSTSNNDLGNGGPESLGFVCNGSSNHISGNNSEYSPLINLGNPIL